MIEQFQREHPNIQVKSILWKYGELTSGSYGGTSFPGDVNEVFLTVLSPVDRAMDLRQLAESDGGFDFRDLDPTAVKLFTDKGKLWAIPIGFDFPVMFYDKTLFDENRVPYPKEGWSLEEFEQAAGSITHPEQDVFGYGISRYYLPDWQIFIYRHDGRLVDSLDNPKWLEFDDPLTFESMQWYAGLVYKRQVAPNPEQFQAFGVSYKKAFYCPTDHGFLNGKVGMFMGVFSERGGINPYVWENQWERPWGMTTLPVDANEDNFALATGLEINSASLYPEASWELVKYISRQTPHDLAPVRKSQLNSPKYAILVGEEEAKVVQASMKNLVAVHHSYYSLTNVLYDGINDLMNGVVTSEEMMQQLKSAIRSP